MPNPVKYKSVGISIDAYDKLIFIAAKEDRALGRQLSRMIDDVYKDILSRTKLVDISDSAKSLGGLSAALKD